MHGQTREAKEWRKIAALWGRGDDVINLTIDSLLKLNFLQYEASRPGAGGELVENLLAFSKNMLSVLSHKQGGGTDEAFW